MALTLTSSPLPYTPSSMMTMLEMPLAPFPARRVLSDQLQNECADHLSSFEFPFQKLTPTSNQHSSLLLQPRRSSALMQESLARMKQRGESKRRGRSEAAAPAPAETAPAPTTQSTVISVNALAAALARSGVGNSRSKSGGRAVLTPQRSIRLARLDGKNSPNSSKSSQVPPIRRSASFGRARLSPVRSLPTRTRSCGQMVV